MRLFLLMLVLLGCVPATASAVTIDEVVALAKSGVSEQVVVAGEVGDGCHSLPLPRCPEPRQSPGGGRPPAGGPEHT
jgi:hypothetical protein